MMVHFLVGLATGILSGCGIGGGSLLVLYLTNLAGMEQSRAGGVNLLYFLCCAPAALVSHIRNRLIETKVALWCTVAGVPAAIAASLLANSVDVSLLRRGFGVLLLYIGARELLAKVPKKDTNDPHTP